MKTKQNKLKLQIFEGIRFRLSSRCKVTTGSKLELVPCLEEDRIDRKCLGREIDNERVEMPLECRSLADLCTRNRRRGGGGEGIRRRGRKGRSQCGLLSSHGLHTFTSSLTSCSTAPRSYPISTSCVSLRACLLRDGLSVKGIQDRVCCPSFFSLFPRTTPCLASSCSPDRSVRTCKISKLIGKGKCRCRRI